MTTTEPINDNNIPRQKSLETVSLQKDQIEPATKNYNKAEEQHDESAILIKLTNIDKALQLLLADYIEENLGKNIKSSLRLRGGEGTNFNVPASCDQTANGLTIIINIPPIWENSTGEAAGQSRGFDLINVMGKGEDYLKQGIDLYTGLGDTPLNADNIVKASKGTLANTLGFGGFGGPPLGGIGGLSFRSAPIGHIPPSGGSEYCSPGCAEKRIRKFENSTPTNARSLDVQPMNPSDIDELHYASTLDSNQPNVGTRGMNIGNASEKMETMKTVANTIIGTMDISRNTFESIEEVPRFNFSNIMNTADKYKHQFDNTYNRTKNWAGKADGVLSNFGLGARSAAISNAQTLCECSEADARGFSLGDIMNTADKYKHQFDNAYDTAKKVTQQGREAVSSFGGVGSRSAAISNAQTLCDCSESDARGFSLGDIMNTADKYKHQFDNAYDTAKKVTEQGREVFSSFGGVGSRSADISTGQTSEADARGFGLPNFGKFKHQFDKTYNQFDKAYSTAKNVKEQGRGVLSSLGGVDFNKPSYAASALKNFGVGSVVASGVENFGVQPTALSAVKNFVVPPISAVENFRVGRGIAGIASDFRDDDRDQMEAIDRALAENEKNIQMVHHNKYKGPLSAVASALIAQGMEQADAIAGGVGSRSAAISNAQILCDCSEADARGLSFGDILNKADQYKEKVDTTYNTVKNMSEQGNSLINSFRDVGARGAPIADAKTPFIFSESDPRGFDFSGALAAVDKYKHKIDDAYSTGKSLAEQGHGMYDTFKEDVGLRSAAITNQSHGEDYCTPCGKQNASQMDSIKAQLDSAEARDSLIIDQVRQQQQTRRQKVTQMLGNR